MALADWPYRVLTAGLTLTSIYLTGTFSYNLYQGISWHKAQSKLEAAAVEGSGGAA